MSICFVFTKTQRTFALGLLEAKRAKREVADKVGVHVGDLHLKVDHQGRGAGDGGDPGVKDRRGKRRKRVMSGNQKNMLLELVKKHIHISVISFEINLFSPNKSKLS